MQEVYISLDAALGRHRTRGADKMQFREDRAMMMKIRKLVWSDVVAVLKRDVVAWPCWIPAPPASAQTAPPQVPKLGSWAEIEVVTPAMLQELDPGWYKWGDLRVEAADRESAALSMTEEWRSRREQKLEAQELAGVQKKHRHDLEHVDAVVRPGLDKVLTHARFNATFHGRVWRDGDIWHFHEAGTACKVHVVVPKKVSPHMHATWAEGQLYKALRAEHAKAATKNRPRPS